MMMDELAGLGAPPGQRIGGGRTGFRGGSQVPAGARLLDGPRDLGIRSRLVGRRIHYVETVDSSSTFLKSLASKGEPAGAVVVAGEQTRGRGRAGRAWFSPRGLGLWFSVLLRPDGGTDELAPLPIVVAASVAEALADASGVALAVKWPNDIVCGGRKLGGILLESVRGVSGAVGGVIIGVGLNVGMDRGDFPAEIAEKATSLTMLSGHRFDRLSLLRSLLERLDEDWASFEAEGAARFLKRWRALSTTIGTEIEVVNGGSAVRGKAVGLSPSGALILETPAGRRVEILSGDVVDVGQ